MNTQAAEVFSAKTILGTNPPNYFTTIVFYYKKSGGLHLVEPGLTAGYQADKT